MIKITGALLGALLFVMPIGILPPKTPPPVGAVEMPYSDQYVALASVAAMGETDVLANVGAFPRDAWAQAVIDEIANRSWVAQVTHQDERGGYPDLAALFD